MSMKTLCALSLSLLIFACANTGRAVTHVLSGPMDPMQATTNPSNVGDGIGTISGDYDSAANILNYTLTWMDLTSPITNAHFHIGAPGTPGGVALGIPGPWSSPYTQTDLLLTAAQEDKLLDGLWYVNLHTQNFGGGEIRGQVLVNVIPEPSSFMLVASLLVGAGIRTRGA